MQLRLTEDAFCRNPVISKSAVLCVILEYRVESICHCRCKLQTWCILDTLANALPRQYYSRHWKMSPVCRKLARMTRNAAGCSAILSTVQRHAVTIDWFDKQECLALFQRCIAVQELKSYTRTQQGAVSNYSTKKSS